MDLFLWGHPKEHVYAVFPRTVEDLVARCQTAVTTADAKILRRVRKNAVWRTAAFLETGRGHFDSLL
jgi:hypothetical protein